MDIKLITAKETYALRNLVLRPNQPLSACQYLGDEIGFHMGAYNNAALVSIISFYLEEKAIFSAKSQYRIRGMATDPKWQRTGMGTVLLRSAIDFAKSRGVNFFWCNARESAISFYEKQDFQIYGNLFQIEGIGPHKIMFREL